MNSQQLSRIYQTLVSLEVEDYQCSALILMIKLF
jgi:hypothetical protein